MRTKIYVIPFRFRKDMTLHLNHKENFVKAKRYNEIAYINMLPSDVDIMPCFSYN